MNTRRYLEPITLDELKEIWEFWNFYFEHNLGEIKESEKEEN